MELNNPDFTEQKIYLKAKKRAREIRGFYINLSLYCIIIPILIAINLIYTPEMYWFPFSMLGWGLGLLFHGMEAFDWNPFFGKDWEERKIAALLEKENRKHHKNNDNE